MLMGMLCAQTARLASMASAYRLASRPKVLYTFGQIGNPREVENEGVVTVGYPGPQKPLMTTSLS